MKNKNSLLKMKQTFKSTVEHWLKKVFFIAALFTLMQSVSGQVNTGGCLLDDFGINATLYVGSNFGGVNPPAGIVDWFKTNTGRNTIIQDASTVSALQALLQGSSINPVYEVRMNGGLSSYVDSISPRKYKILYDALFARDMFGGSGGIDNSAFVVASKNAQDPADWTPGEGNVLGKNDLIDVAGHMFRSVDLDLVPPMNDLNFVGIINRAEPGGSAYMDFEFYIQDISVYQPTPTTYKFTTGGPDMGHTSFTFTTTGQINQLGDMIYNVSLTSGGTTTNIEARIWVKYTDYLSFTANPQNLPFRFGPDFDGVTTGAPYGYASILPKPGISQEFCGYVNTAGQLPAAPPWGTRNTKSNIYSTAYSEYSVAEIGLNLTSVGIDNYLVQNADPCSFPWRTFLVKTRTSDSFTSALKDFSGPHNWAQPTVTADANISTLSCDNSSIILSASPLRNDVAYSWTTLDGHIFGSNTSASIQADQPGTYYVEITTINGCKYLSDPFVITMNPAKPLFNGNPVFSYAVPCSGNDGMITTTVSGGTPPYTYFLYNADDNSLVKQASLINSVNYTFTGVNPGNYWVEVKGTYACTTRTSSFTIPARTPVTYTPTITNVNCYGQTTGSIVLGTKVSHIKSV